MQVGYDAYSYAYRDLEGSKVHSALREVYGAPYKEGDVIGCLLHLPPGGLPFQTRPEVITHPPLIYSTTLHIPPHEDTSAHKLRYNFALA